MKRLASSLSARTLSREMESWLCRTYRPTPASGTTPSLRKKGFGSTPARRYQLGISSTWAPCVSRIRLPDLSVRRTGPC
jgi:hypothetical protein